MKWRNRGHELEQYREHLSGKTELLFYGMNQKMMEVYKRVIHFKNIGVKISFYDDSIKGRTMAGKEVGSFLDAIEKLRLGKSVMIISACNTDEYGTLLRTLIKSGFIQNMDFYEVLDFQRIFIAVYFLCVFDKCYIEQIGHTVNWACTQKCKKCSASIPYLKQKNPSIEQVKDEIDLIFSKADYIHVYDLTSGETFLASDLLAEVILYLFENYGKNFGEIWMVTNATVIPSENMLKILEEHKQDIRIIVSAYNTVNGWPEKFAAFQSALQNRGISFEMVRANQWLDLGFGEADLVVTEKEQEIYFDRCWTDCRLYKDGIIYYCGHGHTANMAFYKENDEIGEVCNIREADVNKDVIVEYNLGYSEKGYLDVCRHCYGQYHRNRRFIPVAEQI